MCPRLMSFKKSNQMGEIGASREWPKANISKFGLWIAQVSAGFKKKLCYLGGGGSIA